MKFPSHILALAQKAGGEPLAFRETPGSIVIVFVDGRKLFFDREQSLDSDTDGEQGKDDPVLVQTVHAPSPKPKKGRKA